MDFLEGDPERTGMESCLFPPGAENRSGCSHPALPRPSPSCCPLQTPLLISPAKFLLSLLYEFLMQKQEPALLQSLPIPQTSLSPELWGKPSPSEAELQHKRALCAHFIKCCELRFWEQYLNRDLKKCLCDGFVNSTENMHRAADRSLYWAKFAS